MNKNKRSTFSGKLGFVLSAAGASVGLGNIWRFPYLAAKYGGGIFLLIYIILALTFGYTMIMAETSLGRMTKKSPVGAYQSFGKSKWLSLGGWINAIIPILIVQLVQTHPLPLQHLPCSSLFPAHVCRFLHANPLFAPRQREICVPASD